MNFKKIFGKILSKEALLIIDVIVCPILALLFFAPITDLIPSFILGASDIFSEVMFRVAMFRSNAVME